LLSHKLKWKLRSTSCIRMGIQAAILHVTQDGWHPFCKGGGNSAFVSVQCCLVVFKNWLLAGHQEFVWIEGRKKELWGLSAFLTSCLKLF
jgi:hypothetical protein